MMNHTALKAHTDEFLSKLPIDEPFTLNSFNGTFAFTDHDLVPGLIQDLVLSQRSEDKFKKIPITAVTEIANKFWEGPGSCVAISNVIWHARVARAYGATITESKVAYVLGRTAEEWAAIDKEKKGQ